jgi:hypothetical protein
MAMETMRLFKRDKEKAKEIQTPTNKGKQPEPAIMFAIRFIETSFLRRRTQK